MRLPRFPGRTRRRELAIRAALGARRQDLALLLLRSEMWPVVWGTGAGLLTAFITGRRLFGSTFETSPHDATTYMAVAAGLLLITLIATYAPARSASAANPVDAHSVGWYPCERFFSADSSWPRRRQRRNRPRIHDSNPAR
jgi:FtsX-like permease family